MMVPWSSTVGEPSTCCYNWSKPDRVVLNPDRFQFSSKCVDFAGFRISESTIAPLPKYLDAIRDFPSPSSTTYIRSWFGLVNQVANYVQLRDTMSHSSHSLARASSSHRLQNLKTPSKPLNRQSSMPSAKVSRYIGHTPAHIPPS